jgi:hypothetical protein
MPLDNPLADGQADPGAGILGPGVEALEYLEYTLKVLRTDPDPVVAHGKQPHLILLLLRGDMNARGVRPAELDRVGQ